MSLAALEPALPVPDAVQPIAAVELEVAQLLLQSALPPDYLAFLARYGCIVIPGLLRVLGPAEAIHQLLVQLDAMNTTRLLVGWKRGASPGVGDFVPWAIADSGAILYFRTAPRPAQWPVMLGAAGVAPKHLRAYPLTMTTFLTELLTGKLQVPELPTPSQEPSPMRLEYVADGSSKFWEIAVTGRDVVVRWGRIGAEGQAKTTRMKTPALATEAAAKQVKEKLAKGYVEAGAKKKEEKKAPKPKKAGGGLAALIKLVKPPKAPVEAPRAAQWKAHEKSLGVALPDDYKAMVEAYGTGCFDGFVWLANPFSKLMPWKRWFEGTNAGLHEAGHEGLLPWASSENGNVLCFRMSDWTTVVTEGRGSRIDELPGGATDALAALLSGRDLDRHRFDVKIDEQKTSIHVKLDKRAFADRLAFLRAVAGKAKVEQTYTDEAIVRVTGTTIRLTYRDCDEEDDGRVGAEIFACYAVADEAEVRRIVRAATAAAKWKLEKIVDFATKQPRWPDGP